MSCACCVCMCTTLINIFQIEFKLTKFVIHIIMMISAKFASDKRLDILCYATNIKIYRVTNFC